MHRKERVVPRFDSHGSIDRHQPYRHSVHAAIRMVRSRLQKNRDINSGDRPPFAQARSTRRPPAIRATSEIVWNGRVTDDQDLVLIFLWPRVGVRLRTLRTISAPIPAAKPFVVPRLRGF